MRIIVIGPSYPFKGGISHFNTLLCKELSKKHSVKLIDYVKRYPSILHPAKTQIDKSKNKVAFPGIKILNMINPSTWVNAFLIIKKFKPKIAVMYWYSSLFSPLLTTISYLTKKFTKTKIVVFCHNAVLPEKRPLDSFFEKMFFKHVDYFIAATKHDYTLIKRKYPHHKILINPHPNYNIFNYKNFNKNSAKKKLKIKGKSILIFGYMRRYKGLENLLKAMPLIPKKQKIKLMIVGEFWGDIKKYKSLANKLGITNNILFIDRYVNNEEVEIFFKSCDVVITPYTSHTNSGVIQLAFSFNKPIIATDVGGFREVVGNKGFIVKRNDPKAIAEAVIKFYKNQKEKEFVKNIKKNKYKHSWNKIIKTIEKIH